LIAGFFIRSPTVRLVTLALMGFFWALININSLPMVYDLGDEGSIGVYTGLYYFASSAAAITGPILGGWLIDRTSHGAIWTFSAFFMVLAVLAMLRIREIPKPV